MSTWSLNRAHIDVQDVGFESLRIQCSGVGVRRGLMGF